jgi:hypothetical protein
MDNFEDELLKHDIFSDLFISPCNEKEGSQRDEYEDINFRFSSHSLGVDCFKFCGDPIYDTDLDDSREESAEISLNNLQLYLMKDDSVYFHHMGHVNDKKTSEIFW